MKFTVDAGLLKKVCTIFHTGEYPVLFRAYMGDPGHVVLNGFDGYKYMEAAFDAFVIDPGELFISSQYLDRFGRLEGTVLMSYLGDDLTLKDETRPFHIPLLPVATRTLHDARKQNSSGFYLDRSRGSETTIQEGPLCQRCDGRLYALASGFRGVH